MTNRASNKLTTTRKMTVRVALASGATIATLFGVESLSTRDLAALMPTVAATAPADVDDLLTPTTQLSSEAVSVITATASIPAASSTPIPPAAPSLVIIRNAGGAPVATMVSQPTTVPTKQSAAVQIKPPNAVVVSAPPAASSSSGSSAAVQPAPAQPAPSTRSSR